MREPYRSAGCHESTSHYGTVGVKVEIALNREQTKEEQILINKFLQEFQNLVYKNTLLSDPTFIIQCEVEKRELLACFPAYVYAAVIPNEYHSQRYNPWFYVTTKIGPIKIGWRKRVINIDWTDSEQTAKADDLFPSEGTTKGDRYIHAWSYEKAREYIKTIIGE